MKITDKLTITNEDNMLLMARYPDNYFDLAIVDPPYGIDVTKCNMGGRKRGKEDKKKSWDNAVPTDSYFKELFRVSKNQIIWGGNYFNLPISRYFMVWDKGETMYGRDFAEAELAWVRSGGTRIYKRSPNQLDRIHPTQKPENLYSFCLKQYANDIKCDNCGGCGQYSYLIGTDCDYRTCQVCKGYGIIKPKILDTHLGSGSIAIACHDYGFELTACELDTDYYNKAIERIKNHVKQLTLF